MMLNLRSCERESKFCSLFFFHSRVYAACEAVAFCSACPRARGHGVVAANRAAVREKEGDA